jgi:hypothetical protein
MKASSSFTFGYQHHLQDERRRHRYTGRRRRVDRAPRAGATRGFIKRRGRNSHVDVAIPHFITCDRHGVPNPWFENCSHSVGVSGKAIVGTKPTIEDVLPPKILRGRLIMAWPSESANPNAVPTTASPETPGNCSHSVGGLWSCWCWHGVWVCRLRGPGHDGDAHA